MNENITGSALWLQRKDNDDVRDQVRDQEEFRCVVRK